MKLVDMIDPTSVGEGLVDSRVQKPKCHWTYDVIWNPLFKLAIKVL